MVLQREQKLLPSLEQPCASHCEVPVASDKHLNSRRQISTVVVQWTSLAWADDVPQRLQSPALCAMSQSQTQHVQKLTC